MINKTPLAYKVYQLLTQIPQGKVMTYGQIAKQVKSTSPRLIGKFLHLNTDPIKYPCYKVVNAQGKVSPHYAYGGKKIQIQKLAQDEIIVKNNRVDLKKYLWQK